MINLENCNEQERQEQLLDVVSYILTSTRGLYREPQCYGPIEDD
ncbi:DUF6092 family protein [Anaerobacillus isosaccharinicus]|uniref:DUF6092 family protein n=1 Tax=Anaerobacillus isosaccharinicus TaxID=1532552 RepID=A0AC62A471_9BACI